jgi:ubiquinone/menaquinone biosynthesis C-methylase UbiE
MKMNRLEKLFIRSPLRVFVLRKFEAPRVLTNLNLASGGVCLEVGCGIGAGALLINQYLKPERVIGVDLDPDMVASARRYLSHSPGWAKGIRRDNIEIVCEDASHLSFPTGHFDAAFHFAVLDHIPEWAEVIAETYRVLKPGGAYAFEEFLLSPGFQGRWGHVSFAERDIRAALEKSGFAIESFETARRLPRCFVRAKKKGLNNDVRAG